VEKFACILLCIPHLIRIDFITRDYILNVANMDHIVGHSIVCSAVQVLFFTVCGPKFAKLSLHNQERSQFATPFLPCDALRCTVSVIVIMSVRLFVCPSVCHTRGLCPHCSTYDHDFFNTGYPIILVSGDITFIPKFEGGHPERGR